MAVRGVPHEAESVKRYLQRAAAEWGGPWVPPQSVAGGWAYAERLRSFGYRSVNGPTRSLLLDLSACCVPPARANLPSAITICSGRVQNSSDCTIRQSRRRFSTYPTRGERSRRPVSGPYPNRVPCIRPVAPKVKRTVRDPPPTRWTRRLSDHSLGRSCVPPGVNSEVNSSVPRAHIPVGAGAGSIVLPMGDHSGLSPILALRESALGHTMPACVVLPPSVAQAPREPPGPPVLPGAPAGRVCGRHERSRALPGLPRT